MPFHGAAWRDFPLAVHDEHGYRQDARRSPGFQYFFAARQKRDLWPSNSHSQFSPYLQLIGTMRQVILDLKRLM